ncbi:hypothetical protein A8924_0556 [Saccharopolyspora erythraea NRRL 2338]|uniref:Zinc finger protein n=1 Tax=Saccharopolyspora erythraea TaxID=1836 RepID=A0ABN1D404_SACER|nr:hypothetical protein [Saccharopolyspora erythraea]PFG93322.1 hypothetical protein A8924_0556 [Saccharopolyspora erythraea NRRL 2338]
MIDSSHFPAWRYYWLPVPDKSSAYGFVRHAFPGSRINSGPAGSAFCGEDFALATPSEMDWIRAPTCERCNENLKELKGGAGR